MSNHTSHPAALAFARQRGIHVPKPSVIPQDTDLTVTELLGNAKALGLPANTKTRKGDLIAMLNGSSVVSPAVDLTKLTPRQQRRLRKRGLVAA